MKPTKMFRMSDEPDETPEQPVEQPERDQQDAV
jgi:hypothetical protein